VTDDPDDLPAVDEPASDYFDELIGRALEQLPDEFRAQLDSVAIVVDDYPTREQLAATHSHGLFGIYQGIPRTAYAAHGAPVPSKITLFRRPLETYNPDPEALAAAVEDTLFHEIAHHLGISDARLRELAADRRRPPPGSRAATDAR
jgi:predicted Zn-dependent protease with MMP-like domain